MQKCICDHSANVSIYSEKPLHLSHQEEPLFGCLISGFSRPRICFMKQNSELPHPTRTSLNPTQSSRVRSPCNQNELEIMIEASESWFPHCPDWLKTNLTLEADHHVKALSRSVWQGQQSIQLYPRAGLTLTDNIDRPRGDKTQW